MDTNGYLVCNGGGLVFCSVVDVGGGERELWTSCTLTHAHTHTHTQICTQQHEQQLQLLHRYNSNNYTTTVTTIYNHVLSFHPHFFPTKARSIATVPPPQKKKKKPQHAYTSSLSSSICFFRYFVFSLYLRLLLPSPRLSSSAITYTNTRRARVPRSNKAAGMIDR